MNNENYKEVNISFLLRDESSYYDIFIMVKGKLLQYTNKKYDNKESLISLQSKGFETVYLTEEGYDLYIKNRSDEHISILNQKQDEKIQVINEFIKDHGLLKELFKDVGLQSEKIKLIDSLNQKNIQLMKTTSCISDLYESFKLSHKNSIVKKEMEIFVCISILEKMKDIKPEYLEKVSAALLICDLLLTEEEYWDSYNLPVKKLTPKILNHSLDVVTYLPSEYFPPWAISLIKSHHEKIDGTGYPHKFDITNLNVFTTSYLLAEEFVTQLLENQAKLNSIDQIVLNVNKKYRPYFTTYMERSLHSFNQCFPSKKKSEAA